MSAQLPTPETDAYNHQTGWTGVVPFDFARKLERERDGAKQLNRELLDKLEAMQAERDLARQRGFEMADVLERTERELAEAREKITTLATAAMNTAAAYDPRFFRAGKWAVEALHACQLIVMEPVAEKPKPDTFKAHGHTWTRHTPGDPCPVPPDTLVHAYDTLGDIGPYKADTFTWHANRYIALGSNIIGWRYAEKPLPPEMKVGEWAESRIKLASVTSEPGHARRVALDRLQMDEIEPLPPQLVVLPTAAKCGQYADTHLAPVPSSTPADTPEALQNQDLGVVSPARIERATS